MIELLYFLEGKKNIYANLKYGKELSHCSNTFLFIFDHHFAFYSI